MTAAPRPSVRLRNRTRGGRDRPGNRSPGLVLVHLAGLGLVVLAAALVSGSFARWLAIACLPATLLAAATGLPRDLLLGAYLLLHLPLAVLVGRSGVSWPAYLITWLAAALVAGMLALSFGLARDLIEAGDWPGLGLAILAWGSSALPVALCFAGRPASGEGRS